MEENVRQPANAAIVFGILKWPLHFMIAPEDVAQFAAIVMRSRVLSAPVYEIEGPAAYSSNDVAQIFGEYLDREVVAQQIPQEQWISTLMNVGFSEDAARNMALMYLSSLKYSIYFAARFRSAVVINFQF